MKRIVVSFLFHVYVKLIRPVISSFFYFYLTKIKNKISDEEWLKAFEKWHKVRDTGFFDYSDIIRDYIYVSDPWKGLIDFSPRVPEYFFLNRKHARDCDDYARMFYFWAGHHQYMAWEIFVINGFDISTAHAVTVVKWFDRKYYLCNYKIYGNFDSLREAVEYLLRRKQYDRKNFVWVVGRKYE